MVLLIFSKLKLAVSRNEKGFFLLNLLSIIAASQETSSFGRFKNLHLDERAIEILLRHWAFLWDMNTVEKKTAEGWLIDKEPSSFELTILEAVDQRP